MSLLVSPNVIPGEKPRMSDFFTSARDEGFRKRGCTDTRTAAAATTIKPAITMAIFINPSQETSDHTTAGAFYLRCMVRAARYLCRTAARKIAASEDRMGTYRLVMNVKNRP